MANLVSSSFSSDYKPYRGPPRGPRTTSSPTAGSCRTRSIRACRRSDGFRRRTFCRSGSSRTTPSTTSSRTGCRSTGSTRPASTRAFSLFRKKADRVAALVARGLDPGQHLLLDRGLRLPAVRRERREGGVDLCVGEAELLLVLLPRPEPGRRRLLQDPGREARARGRAGRPRACTGGGGAPCRPRCRPTWSSTRAGARSGSRCRRRAAGPGSRSSRGRPSASGPSGSRAGTASPRTREDPDRPRSRPRSGPPGARTRAGGRARPRPRGRPAR